MTRNAKTMTCHGACQRDRTVKTTAKPFHPLADLLPLLQLAIDRAADRMRYKRSALVVVWDDQVWLKITAPKLKGVCKCTTG